MRIVSANLRMSSLETELATRVANNPPCGSGLRLQLGKEWVAYNCDTGDEIDVLELSAAPMATYANIVWPVSPLLLLPLLSMLVLHLLPCS